MILVLFGPPGAGKGTQAEMLTRDYNLNHLSTGDLLRAAVAEGSELGRRARGYMNAGQLVPDDVILEIIRDYIDAHTGEGVLFDGFPRTVAQAEGLDRLVDDEQVRVLSLVVPDEQAINRSLTRRVCRNCGKVYNPASGIMPKGNSCECGGELIKRDDDRAGTIARRLEVYYAQTEPVLDYYRNKDLLLEVNGLGEPDEVFARIKEALS